MGFLRPYPRLDSLGLHSGLSNFKGLQVTVCPRGWELTADSDSVRFCLSCKLPVDGGADAALRHKILIKSKLHLAVLCHRKRLKGKVNLTKQQTSCYNSLRVLMAWWFPWWLRWLQNLPAMQEIPGLGRSPGGGNGCPPQYSCPENSMERGARRATQSLGSQRVGWNWAANTFTFTLD